MISRAAGLSKDEIKALRSALQASQAENKVLKAENKALKSALQRLGSKSSASKTRQVKRSVAGQVRSAVRKPMVSSVRIKAPKVNVEKEHQRQVQKAEASKREMLANMSKEERRQYHLNNLYIPQFIERLNNYFGISGKFSVEQAEMLSKILPRMSKEQLETIMQRVDLDKVMYESETQFSYADIDTDFSADRIFKDIMDGAEKWGMMTAEELLWYHQWVDEFWQSPEGQAELAAQEEEAYQNALIESQLTGESVEVIMEKAGFGKGSL